MYLKSQRCCNHQEGYKIITFYEDYVLIIQLLEQNKKIKFAVLTFKNCTKNTGYVGDLEEGETSLMDRKKSTNNFHKTYH